MSTQKSITETCYQYFLRTITEHIAGSTPDACLVWPFSRSSSGYGKFKRGGVTYSVHRSAHEWLHGHPAHDACHTCDNPPCYNPYHIFNGTERDNQRDCQAKGRGRRGETTVGSAKAILTEAQVRQIRQEYETKTAPQLAEQFGVVTATIYSVVARINWKHIV